MKVETNLILFRGSMRSWQIYEAKRQQQEQGARGCRRRLSQQIVLVWRFNGANVFFRSIGTSVELSDILWRFCLPHADDTHIR